MKDSFMLTYIRDGIVYPVALTAKQQKRLQIAIELVAGDKEKISVISDKPMGEAILCGKKKRFTNPLKHDTI